MRIIGFKGKPSKRVETYYRESDRAIVNRFNDTGKMKVTHQDGSTSKVYPNTGTVKTTDQYGNIVRHYSNNKMKVTHQDGSTSKVYLNNGTVKTTDQYDNIVRHYSDNKKRFTSSDGSSKIRQYAEGKIKTIDREGILVLDYPEGKTKTIRNDGITVRKFPNGSCSYEHGNIKAIFRPDGNRILDTENYILKIFHPDGSTSTYQATELRKHKYPNSNIRRYINEEGIEFKNFIKEKLSIDKNRLKKEKTASYVMENGECKPFLRKHLGTNKWEVLADLSSLPSLVKEKLSKNVAFLKKQKFSKVAKDTLKLLKTFKAV